MTQLRLALASLSQIPMDLESNSKRIITAVQHSEYNKAPVLLLPEMALTGYCCNDWFTSYEFLSEVQEYVKHICEKTKQYSVIFNLSVPAVSQKTGRVYSTNYTILKGSILGSVDKENLANQGVHYEHRWFKEGVNDNVYNCNFTDDDLNKSSFKFAYEICEDAWVPNRPLINLSSAGVNLVLNPSASHYQKGKHSIRRNLVLNSSREFSCVYVYCNLLGSEDGTTIYDGHQMVASNGNMIFESYADIYDSDRYHNNSPFYKEYGVLFNVCDIDLTPSKNNLCRDRIHSSKSSNIIDFENLLPHTPYIKAAVIKPLKPPRFKKEFIKDTDETSYMIFMLAYCLAEYNRKSNVKNVVISLSGGKDSALTLLIAAIAKYTFGYPEKIYTIYQSTEYSSQETKDIAQALGNHLSDKHYLINIDPIWKDFMSIYESLSSKKVESISNQNIQARTRSIIPWTIANQENALLLTCSNRSEASVGYCTMDGDTAGSFNIIGGLSKEEVKQLLSYLSNSFTFSIFGKLADPDKDLISIEDSIKKTITRCLESSPSAELAKDQTDEKDLMPYDVLDFIEEYAIEQKRSPASTLLALKNHPKFSEHSPDLLSQWVQKYYTLFAKNQWKRHRYAHSPHISTRNLDPRSYNRFPIISKFFQKLDK